MIKSIYNAYIEACNKFFDNLIEKECRPEMDIDVLNEILKNNLKNSNTSNKYSKMSRLNAGGCCHKMTRGSRKDNPCGATVIPNTKYCKRHSKIKEDDYENEIKEEENIDLERIYIRRNHFKNFVYGDTGYIIKSSTEKYVVAKEGKEGEWIPLTEQDIKIIRKKYKLRYKIIDFKKVGQTTNEDIVKSVELFKKDTEEPMMTGRNKILSILKDEINDIEE